MHGKTLKIYGTKYEKGMYPRRIFTSLKQFERWVGKGTGVVMAMSFLNGDCIEYRYAYNNGKRRSFKKPFRSEDYYAWNHWWSQHGCI